jgi:hypothetical protein
MLREWSDRVTKPARRVPPALQYVIGGALTLAALGIVIVGLSGA